MRKGDEGDGGNERYDSFLEPKKESKKAACDAKVKLIKLEGGTAAPRGREKLESLGLEQAPPARFCLFPLRSCCARPALICDQRATKYVAWVCGSCAAIGNSWSVHSPKAFPLEGKVGGFSRSDEV